MNSNGKMLENLVSFVEQTSLPAGFTVSTNTKVFDNDGNQTAELDIEIRGTVGTTQFSWLIECRDRQSQGTAPVSWIEQLITRRTRLNFNKLTAVSTSGFSPPAKALATANGIELREVSRLDTSAFSDWLQLTFMTQEESQHELLGLYLGLAESESEAKTQALAEIVARGVPDLRLKKTSNGEVVDGGSAFVGAVSQIGGMFDDLEPNGPPKPVNLRVSYPNDHDHFVVETTSGDVRIVEIVYQGNLRKVERTIPLTTTAAYSGDAGEISQFAAFDDFEVMGNAVAVELHKLAATGETHVVLRNRGKT